MIEIADVLRVSLDDAVGDCVILTIFLVFISYIQCIHPLIRAVIYSGTAFAGKDQQGLPMLVDPHLAHLRRKRVQLSLNFSVSFLADPAEMLSMLYDSVPGVLSELIRTAFIPRPGYKFIVSDFSAIEARVLSHLAGEKWRADVFHNGRDIYCESASRMFGVPVEKHGQNAHLRQKGKIAELALGYGGSVGALKAMGALDMGLTEDELQPLVTMWRESNPKIVAYWWAVDEAVKTAIQTRELQKVGCVRFEYRSGMLFITLPSSRKLAYVKPRIDINKFGGQSVTYMGIDAQKKWSRIESYGPKFAENIVQAVSRDILAYAMRALSYCQIVGHVHDELIIECSLDVSLNAICEQMGRTPPWLSGIELRADGYECCFYQKQ